MKDISWIWRFLFRMAIIAIGAVVLYFIVFITAVYFASRPEPEQRKQEPKDTLAAQKLINFIGLEEVNSDSLYVRSYNYIYNDTMVGLHKTKVFFIHSLSNLDYLKFIEVSQIKSAYSGYTRYPYTHINYYEDGYLYIPDGGSCMERIGLDGSFKEFFKAYRDTLWIPRQLLFYKNLTVIACFNGVFVFDRHKEKLLWKYKYEHSPNDAGHSIIGNRLIFIDDRIKIDNDSLHTSSRVFCLNLDSLSVQWERLFVNTDRDYMDENIINNGKDIIAVPYKNGSYFLDINTGRTISKIENIYVNYLLGDLAWGYSEGSIVCWDIRIKIPIWKATGKVIELIYKNYVVGVDKTGYVAYYIYDKGTGVLRKKIPLKARPSVFRFKDKYILVGKTLYK